MDEKPGSILDGNQHLIGTALGAYTTFLLALGYVAIGILVAIGPLFIFAAIFESAKRFFGMWLQQLFNFALITILTAASLRFFLAGVSETARDAIVGTEDVGTTDIMNFLLVTAIGILILRQAMPIASGLAGGMAISTQGAFGAASGAIDRAMGASAKRYMPNQVAQRRRQIMSNARTNKAFKNWKASQPTAADRVKGAASAAATAYKNKFQPNKVAKAA